MLLHLVFVAKMNGPLQIFKLFSSWSRVVLFVGVKPKQICFSRLPCWLSLHTALHHGALPRIYDNFKYLKVFHVLIHPKRDLLTTKIISYNGFLQIQ